ncbi:MAG: hypothetical protein AB1730_13155 [Myxococcota bacterium]|jgi:hypothetical protein
MPALFTYVTAVERLAAHVNTLPAEFTKALGEDLEYARFGASLPELPWFGGVSMGLDAWLGRGTPPHWSRLLATKAPVAFGLKAAELVSNGALVGVEAGLAFLAGYVTQLAVSRALEPLVQSLVVTHQRHGETPATARNRIEWTQSLFFMQDLHGSPLVGTPAVRGKLQLRKGSTFKGIGRGFYELVRVSSQDAFGEAPSKLEVDGWMRGVSLFSMAIGSPLGKLKALPGQHLSAKELYRGPGVDVFQAVDQGLEHAREVLVALGSMIRRNSFTSRSRSKLLELCPEGSPAEVMRSRAA